MEQYPDASTAETQHGFAVQELSLYGEYFKSINTSELEIPEDVI